MIVATGVMKVNALELTGALKSLINHSLRQALGLGKPARHKILPIFIMVLAFLPAVSFVGIAALVGAGTEEFLPTYAGYYGSVVAAIYLLAALIAPELLCPDKRTGMLGVYFASPLDRPRYLLGKAIAAFLLLLIVTLGPPMLMLIAYSLQNIGPDGFGGWLQLFGRILASSAVIGGLYCLVGLAVSAATDRKSVATASIMALIPGSAIITDLLVDIGEVTPHVRLLNVLFLPRALIFRIHDETGGWASTDNPTWTLWAAFFAWFAVCVSWIWYTYRSLLVRR